MLLQILFVVLSSIMHNLTYWLSKFKARKKAWNRRFKPEKSSNNVGNWVAVDIWRPLLYQLSYTPKYSVAACWDTLACREYNTTDTRFCQAFSNTKTPIWVRTCIAACDTHVMRVLLFQKSRVTYLILARHCCGLWPMLDHVFAFWKPHAFFQLLRCGWVIRK